MPGQEFYTTPAACCVHANRARTFAQGASVRGRKERGSLSVPQEGRKRMRPRVLHRHLLPVPSMQILNKSCVLPASRSAQGPCCLSYGACRSSCLGGLGSGTRAGVLRHVPGKKEGAGGAALLYARLEFQGQRAGPVRVGGPRYREVGNQEGLEGLRDGARQGPHHSRRHGEEKTVRVHRKTGGGCRPCGFLAAVATCVCCRGPVGRPASPLCAAESTPLRARRRDRSKRRETLRSGSPPGPVRASRAGSDTSAMVPSSFAMWKNLRLPHAGALPRTPVLRGMGRPTAMSRIRCTRVWRRALAPWASSSR